MAGVVHYLSDNQVDYESSKLLNDTSSARQSFTSMLHSLLLSCYSLQFLVFNPVIWVMISQPLDIIKIDNVLTCHRHLHHHLHHFHTQTPQFPRRQLNRLCPLHISSETSRALRRSIRIRRHE